jgi:hypothetical protein
MFLAARGWDRRARLMGGVVLAAVPLAALSLWLFGTHLPNVADQNRILTQFSFPNVIGLLLGVGGGTHTVLRVMELVVLLVGAYQLLRTLLDPERDWLAAAGWAMLALIASAAWLMPWYVLWLLPLAALGRSRMLRVVAVALTLFLVLTLGPDTTYQLTLHNVNLLNTPAGKASSVIEHKLESGP